MTGALQTTGLAIQGTGGRIAGDYRQSVIWRPRGFSDSTVANGGTLVGAFPNGTGNVAGINAWSASDTDNANLAQFYASATETRVFSLYGSAGSGRRRFNLDFYTDGSSGSGSRRVASFRRGFFQRRAREPTVIPDQQRDARTSVGAIPTSTTLTKGSNFTPTRNPTRK